jgi:predicted MPP superfamily phosphohydrolase
MKDELSRRNFLKLGVFGGICGLTGVYGVSRALAFEVNTYRIPVPHLPGSFDGFTIVQLTDLHHGFGIPIGVIDRVIQQVNLLEKDVIVCTGDYVHSGESRSINVDTVWPRLMTLKAKDGVYSVLGNHDHSNDKGDRSVYWLEKSGQNVRHRAVSISRGTDKIWIGGSGDYWHDDLGIDEAFKHTPPGDCKILLSHNPDAADTKFEARVDLMICGHTHGGQIALPPFASKLSGLQEKPGKNVYISRGIGWYMAPIRINCAPEISVLKLVRANPPVITSS